IETIARVDLRDRLSEIDLPTLVVVGTHDRLTPPRYARRLVSAIPDSRLAELARCGHMPMLERRHEFARLLEEFAAKIG
ncbi:MAG TPA: alpha/beta fold hydrolase, partial [Acidimicrobiales bacterium]|nr:alpha/beta fold hydrolase [Acidimicrobiales bacterium]